MAKIPVPPLDLFHRIPTHSDPVPPEANAPISHYERNSNDAWNLLLYVERNLKRTNVYPAAYDRGNPTRSRLNGPTLRVFRKPHDRRDPSVHRRIL